MNGFPLNPDQLNPEGVELLPASEHELPQLVKISEYAFIEHSSRMSPFEPGGPSGFDSIPWHRKALSGASLFKICAGNTILGGLYFTIKKDGSGWVNRVFIHPDAQGKGLGRRVFALLEQQNPAICLWGLDTPRWAEDNLGFYHSIGYRDREIRYIPEEGFELVILEKKICRQKAADQGKGNLKC
ncbi:MAG: GNAT family N-acetyltransferase [Spirochaetales bacterium]|nr:GNAT family N-acetyltransferase [Spirochaetales bacterium]